MTQIRFVPYTQQMRALGTAVAVIVGILAVSGCAGSSGNPTTGSARLRPIGLTTSSGGSGPLVVPVSARAMHSLELRLSSARFLSPTRLAIPGIAGSSNCPSVPVKLGVRSAHAIRLDLVIGRWSRTASGLRVRLPHAPRGGCLDDLVPTPVVVAIDPRRVDVHHPLKVSLHYPKGTIRRYRRPVVVTVPALATLRVRAEVRAARASNRALFSIFPAEPGEQLCAIPRAGARDPFTGICRTSVRPDRIAQAPAVTVTFTESWVPCPPGAYCPAALRLQHRTWRVIEGVGMPKSGPPQVQVLQPNDATVPHPTTPQIRREVRIARASGRYLSIFPAVLGKRHCAIPDGALGAKPLRGMCFTSVRPVVSHGPSVIVSFAEFWGRSSACPANGYCLVPYEHRAAWQVGESAPLGAKLRVLATRLSGANPPQLYK